MMPTHAMTHAERLRATLAGAAIDRPAIALWRHFPVADQQPDSLAAATLAFQRAYDWDIVKVTPSSSFCLRDWGAQDAWCGAADGTRRYLDGAQVVRAPGDWERLPVLQPDAPHLAAQLRCLRLVRQGMRSDAPLLQTVFNPLAQAKNLAGPATLMAHLRQHPDAVQAGLDRIARSGARFIEALLDIGIDGIFYAVQHAQAGLLDEAAYRRLGLPHDRRMLAPASNLWCNMLHLHGGAVHFNLLDEFEFPIVNWHADEGTPSLAAARHGDGRVLCAGLRQQAFADADAQTIQAECASALAQTQGHRIVLGAGCVLPHAAPHGNLLAARNSVEPSFKTYISPST